MQKARIESVRINEWMDRKERESVLDTKVPRVPDTEDGSEKEKERGWRGHDSLTRECGRGYMSLMDVHPLSIRLTLATKSIRPCSISAGPGPLCFCKPSETIKPRPHPVIYVDQRITSPSRSP